MRPNPVMTAVRLCIALAAAVLLTFALSANDTNHSGGGGGNLSPVSDQAAQATRPAVISAQALATQSPSAPLAQTASEPEPQADMPLPALPALPQAEPGKAVIAFTFDDGYISDYNLAYPILKKYGIRGTSYIIGKFPDSSTPDTLSWAQIKEMAAWDWCFGCHTYAHSDLPTLSDDEIRQSLEEENQAFLRQGLPIPQIMAYPFGKFNARVINDVSQYRLQARMAFYQHKFVDMDHVNPYQIDCISADTQNLKQLKACEALVDKACELGAVIVFRTHCMYFKKRNDNGHWHVQTDSRLFAQLVQYCVDKNCEFVTMEQLMRMYTK